MGVVNARDRIHAARQAVIQASSFLSSYLGAPMHGQIPDWADLQRERHELDRALAAFDEILQGGMDQEWPKPEPTAN
jgi:hypothetical protein